MLHMIMITTNKTLHLNSKISSHPNQKYFQNIPTNNISNNTSQPASYHPTIKDIATAVYFNANTNIFQYAYTTPNMHRKYKTMHNAPCELVIPALVLLIIIIILNLALAPLPTSRRSCGACTKSRPCIELSTRATPSISTL